MAHWELDEKKSNFNFFIMFTLVGKYRKIIINDSLIDDYRKLVNFALKEFGFNSWIPSGNYRKRVWENLLRTVTI